MNENKKILIMGIIVLALISVIPITILVTNNKSKKVYERFSEYINSEELKLVYIGRDNCSYCTLFKPEIDLISKEYGVDYLYINTNNLVQKHFDKLLSDLDINPSEFGTPYLVTVKDGKKVSEQVGYMPESGLFDYLKSQGIIESDAKLPLNYIDYQEYSKLISSKSKQLIVIAQSGCEGCVKARPIMYELAKEYGVKINYLNASLISQEDAPIFQDSLEYFKENGISTPLMLVVSNNKVVDALAGSASKDSYIKFLTNNGYIKK